MNVLVYTRNSLIGELRPTFEARFSGTGDRVRFRNADAHAEGDVEACDVVLVDDDFPQVADDYRGVTFDGHTPEVNLFRAAEVGHDAPVPEPEQDLPRDAFASTTAYDTAVEAGLSMDDLGDLEPAGKTGYTTAQVRQMAEG